MDEIRIGEQQLVALIAEKEQERERAEQRRIAAEHAVQEHDAELVMMRGTLSMYRRKHGLPAPERGAVNTEQATAYFHKSAREIVSLWADQNRDRVVLKDMYRYLVAIGLYADVGEAHRTLSRIYARMPELKRVARGIYHRQRTPETETIAPLSAPQAPTGWPTDDDENMYVTGQPPQPPQPTPAPASLS